MDKNRMRKHYNLVPKNRLVDPECDAFHARSRRAECRKQRQKVSSQSMSKFARRRPSPEKCDARQEWHIAAFSGRSRRDARIHALQIERQEEQSTRNRVSSLAVRKSKLDSDVRHMLTYHDSSRLREVESHRIYSLHSSRRRFIYFTGIPPVCRGFTSP